MTTPEEELYVLVYEKPPYWAEATCRSLADGYAGPIAEIEELKKSLGDAYGKTRIARLQFVEEE